MSKPKKIVRQDGSVVYRIVYDAGHDPDTGKRKQITRTFDRKKDADAELARVTHQRATGAYVVPSKLTLDRMLDEFLRRPPSSARRQPGRTMPMHSGCPGNVSAVGWCNPSRARTSRR
jgi:hypothetical protein